MINFIKCTFITAMFFASVVTGEDAIYEAWFSSDGPRSLEVAFYSSGYVHQNVGYMCGNEYFTSSQLNPVTFAQLDSIEAAFRVSRFIDLPKGIGQRTVWNAQDVYRIRKRTTAGTKEVWFYNSVSSNKEHVERFFRIWDAIKAVINEAQCNK